MTTKKPLGFLPPTEEQAATDITTDSLKRLSALVDALQAKDEEVAGAEEDLRQLKEAQRQLSEVEIPNLLLQHNISRVRLADKREVLVKDVVSVSVPDEHKQTFFQFLTNRHEDDIVKTVLRLPRTESELLKKLFVFLEQILDIDYSTEESVHPSTLKKYFSELLGLDADEDERAEGVAAGRYLRAQDVEEFAKVFVLHRTKIKVPVGHLNAR